jgi:hypothetical protein
MSALYLFTIVFLLLPKTIRIMISKIPNYLFFILIGGAGLCLSGYPYATTPINNVHISSLRSASFINDSANTSKTGLWKTPATTQPLSCVVKIKKNKFRQLLLNYSDMKTRLLKAPDEKNRDTAKPVIIDLPYPDGSFQPFNITKSTIMSAVLAAKYPELNAYTGVNVLQPAESVRCECTLEGFKAMITTLKGTVLINNCIKKDSLTYITYYKNDLIAPKKKKFEKIAATKSK